MSTKAESAAPSWPHEITASSYVESQKSTFVAHCSRLTAASDLPALISHLEHSSSRMKRATHCMWAYRLTGTGGTSSSVISGQDDGGEDGAGSMLAGVLEKGECMDVAVIVWRWYGGVKMGGERWRIIGRVAREALREAGFLKEGKEAKGAGGKTKAKSRRSK